MDITPGVRGAPARWRPNPTLGIQEPLTPGEHERIRGLSYTEDEARFLYIVANHSGYFVSSQFLDVNVGNFHMFKISGWILVSPTWAAELRPAGHTPRAAKMRSSARCRHYRPSKSRSCVLPCEQHTNPHHLNGVRSTFASGASSSSGCDHWWNIRCKIDPPSGKGKKSKNALYILRAPENGKPQKQFCKFLRGSTKFW